MEFLIWAPLMTYIGVAMFVLSYYLATASEVQQVANEVARSSFRVVNVEGVEGDLCTAMDERVLPSVVSRMAIVTYEGFRPIGACPSYPDADRFVTVAVTYDLTETSLHRLGRLIGLDLTTVTRQSTVQL